MTVVVDCVSWAKLTSFKTVFAATAWTEPFVSYQLVKAAATTVLSAPVGGTTAPLPL